MTCFSGFMAGDTSSSVFVCVCVYLGFYLRDITLSKPFVGISQELDDELI